MMATPLHHFIEKVKEEVTKHILPGKFEKRSQLSFLVLGVKNEIIPLRSKKHVNRIVDHIVRNFRTVGKHFLTFFFRPRELIFSESAF